MSINGSAYAGWELFASVFGVSTVLVGILYNLIVSQLPSRRVKGLCEALSETQSFLDCCIEEGVLRECHIQTFQRCITVLRRRTNEIRACVHDAQTWSEDFNNWARGFTSRIKRIANDVNALRSDISTTSNREREERDSAEPAHRVATDVSARPAAVNAHSTSGTVQAPVRRWRLLSLFPARGLPTPRKWSTNDCQARSNASSDDGAHDNSSEGRHKDTCPSPKPALPPTLPGPHGDVVLQPALTGVAVPVRHDTSSSVSSSQSDSHLLSSDGRKHCPALYVRTCALLHDMPAARVPLPLSNLAAEVTVTLAPSTSLSTIETVAPDDED